MRLIKNPTLLQQKLLWIAIGAGLSAFAFIAHNSFKAYEASRTFLIIAGSSNSKLQEATVAAVGECLGQFKMQMWSHGFDIRIPTSRLTNDDYICIIRDLRTAIQLVKVKDYYAETGMVAVMPELIISQE